MCINNLKNLLSKKCKLQSPHQFTKTKKGIHLILNAKPNSTCTMVQYIDNENIGFHIKAPAHDNKPTNNYNVI